MTEPHASPHDRIRARLAPLQPLDTGMTPRTPALDDIRAVVFDVYGTLLISASGDIGPAAAEDKVRAMRGALQDAGIASEADPATLAEIFNRAILDAQELRRREGIEFPEVEIREVWQSFLDAIPGSASVTAAQRDALALEFELRANPVWPMPGMQEALAALRARGLLLGIVSNAQFYTPLLLEHFLGVSLEDAGFAPELCVYSFEEREGKPSQALYRKLAARLKARGLSPAQCLYIGNDLRNDVWPAQATGFRTALFAGDRRSLRLRTDDPRCSTVQPDWIVTALDQIPAALA